MRRTCSPPLSMTASEFTSKISIKFCQTYALEFPGSSSVVKINSILASYAIFINLKRKLLCDQPLLKLLYDNFYCFKINCINCTIELLDNRQRCTNTQKLCIFLYFVCHFLFLLPPDNKAITIKWRN